MTTTGGIVYLIGAGPGDPGLITVRGLSILRRADVVIHDRLIGQELLAEAKGGALIINGGKEPGTHRYVQARIDSLMIEHARRGRLVVRLKGGDPFVFGRGFEEMTTCRGAGVDCVVIPGVSSAFAAPAAAGVPITSRQLVRSLAIVTGRTAHESEVAALDYAALAGIDAISILMGRRSLARLSRALIDAGRDPSTPAACIEWATTPRQRVTTATLATIADAADRDGLCSPVVTVVGRVAAFARPHRVADQASLAGKRIVLTRSRARTGGLYQRLAAQGAFLIQCPVTRIAPVTHPGPVDDAIKRVNRYAWIVFGFSSGTNRVAGADGLGGWWDGSNGVYAVRGFARRLAALGKDTRALATCHIAAVGDRTVRALAAMGIKADRCLADGMTAAELPGALGARGRRRVLVISGGHAGNAVFDESAGDCVVDRVSSFEIADAAPAAHVRRLIETGVDGVILFDAHSARRYAALGLAREQTVFAAFDERTAAAARAAGLSRVLKLSASSAERAVTELRDHLGSTAADGTMRSFV